MLSKLIGFAAFAYLARVLEPEAYGSLELAVGSFPRVWRWD